MEKKETIKIYRITEYIKTSRNMVKHGGSFVKQLGKLMTFADLENRRKLQETFPEYFKKYLNI